MEAPIIFACVPRSGTTWLSEMFQRIPEVCLRTHRSFDTVFLYSLYPFHTLNPLGDDSISPGPLDSFRKSFLQNWINMTSSNTTEVLLSPSFTGYLSILVDSFSDAKYVHLERETLDVIASMLIFIKRRAKQSVLENSWRKDKKYLFTVAQIIVHSLHSFRWWKFPYGGYLGYRPLGFQQVARFPLIEFLCWYYVSLENQIQNVLSTIPSDNIYRLHYEDLVLDFKMEFRSLLDFMGISVSEKMVEVFADSVRRTSIKRYKKSLSDEEISIVKKTLGDY